MIVVSDTSPIRALSFIEQLSILEKLFGAVVIPPAVVDELAHPARLAIDDSPVMLAQFPLSEVRAPVDASRVDQLAQILDRGESEAIVLAEELRCSAILVDEAAGRRIALRKGLVPLGSAGMLQRQKKVGFLREVRPLLDRLNDDLGFFIGHTPHRQILELAGE